MIEAITPHNNSHNDSIDWDSKHNPNHTGSEKHMDERDIDKYIQDIKQYYTNNQKVLDEIDVDDNSDSVTPHPDPSSKSSSF